MAYASTSVAALPARKAMRNDKIVLANIEAFPLAYHSVRSFDSRALSGTVKTDVREARFPGVATIAACVGCLGRTAK
jgi:hypothetical protein